MAELVQHATEGKELPQIVLESKPYGQKERKKHVGIDRSAFSSLPCHARFRPTTLSSRLTAKITAPAAILAASYDSLDTLVSTST